MNVKYPILIRWSVEDAGFIATCEDFPGVSAFGETYEEAAKEMNIALEIAIDTTFALGRKLPNSSSDKMLKQSKLIVATA